MAPADPGAAADGLAHVVETLGRHGRVAVAALPVEPGRLGLESDGSHAWLPHDVALLEAPAIAAGLSARAGSWLRELEVHRVIGSTSTLLAERSLEATVAGCVHLAELQLAGRGRRGRTWLSPLGGNVAVSLGFRSEAEAARLGGLSLVIGLAVLDALEQLGFAGLGLKWPNDLLLEDAKVAGILVELLQTQRGPEFVVGIGLNVRLPDSVRGEVGQPIADLRQAGLPLPDRSRLAAGLISSVVEFVLEFQARGFEPFRSAFDARHRLYGRTGVVTGSGGTEPVRGEVLGVSGSGGLRLATAAGVREFHGGEVSLRRAPGDG